MKLLDIPRCSRIYGEISDGSEYITYRHPDGMYSYCESEKGAVIHLSLFTPLLETDTGYKLA